PAQLLPQAEAEQFLADLGEARDGPLAARPLAQAVAPPAPGRDRPFLVFVLTHAETLLPGRGRQGGAPPVPVKRFGEPRGVARDQAVAGPGVSGPRRPPCAPVARWPARGGARRRPSGP